MLTHLKALQPRWRPGSAPALLLLLPAILFATAPETTAANWSLIGPAPPIRFGHALAYDSIRERVVMFGGFSRSEAYLSDTWEYDGVSWVKRFPALSPPAMFGHVMTFDNARGRVVLFGGGNESGGMADTWEWDGTTWHFRTPALSPDPPVGSPGMAYDSARGRTVLFEGGVYTWEWDGATWVRLPPVPPGFPPDGTGPMVYDSARGRMVLFDTSDGETWEYDGVIWANVTPASGPHLEAAAMAFDSGVGRTVLIAGGGAPAETWAWDGVAWQDISPAVTPHPLASIAYDASRNRLVSFGGDVLDPGTHEGTWEWDGVSWERYGLFVRPPGRIGHAMADGCAGGDVLLFGGGGFGGNYSDTWVLTGETWTNPTPAVSPSGRHYHALASDCARGRVVLFGGSGLGGDLGDTWEWNGISWQDVTPAVSPPPRSNHAMGYDSARGRVVLFGGSGGPGVSFSDTWEWDGTSWTNVPTAASPTGEPPYAMAYDAARGRAVLFQNDSATWEWDGATWVLATPATSPPARSLFSIAYDRGRERVILFGGRTFSSGWLSDTWAWDGADWTEITDASEPSARELHAMAFGGAPGRVVLFGGQIGGLNSLDDTWQLVPAVETVCDGMDDNGNGQVDEGCDDDADGFCDAGMIVVGVPTACPQGGGDCDDSDPAVHPGAAEFSCNGADDDCDAAADEDYASNVSCFLPGVCAAGNAGSTCVAGVETSCQTGVPSGVPESQCNGADDDCDGVPDEDYIPDESCFFPGVCAALNAASTCVDGVETPCETGTPSGVPESGCNGDDDNCDGLADEDYVSDTSCFLPGVCAAGNAASTCVAGVEVVCQTGSPTGIPESQCNGADDDCDGSNDEDFVMTPTACGIGACGSTGVMECVAGSVTDTCAPGSPAAGDATCDNLDDDCDGAVDEEFISAPTICGLGECASSGVATCIGGVPGDTCVPGQPSAEVCDGADNDCDGIVPGSEADADMDGARICEGDCDDSNGTVLAPPTIVAVLDVQDIPGGMRITWQDQAPSAGVGTVYDAFSGHFNAASPPGDFSTGECFAENHEVTFLEYTGAEPPAGDALYFMFRAQNACPAGTGSYGTPGRDSTASQSANPCL